MGEFWGPGYRKGFIQLKKLIQLISGTMELSSFLCKKYSRWFELSLFSATKCLLLGFLFFFPQNELWQEWTGEELWAKASKRNSNTLCLNSLEVKAWPLMPLYAWICHVSGLSAGKKAVEALLMFDTVLATSSSPSPCLKVMGEPSSIPHPFQKAFLKLTSKGYEQSVSPES